MPGLATLGVAALLPVPGATADESAEIADGTPPIPVAPPPLKVPYLGENLPLSKVLGQRATLFVNIKLDDPRTGQELAPLENLARLYGPKGLRVVAVPTDQGWFEPDTSDVIRQKAKYAYNYGGTVNAIVLDKLNVETPKQHPLYTFLVNTLPTPAGGKRIGLNYEKFLLDASGRPLRRYPRRYSAADITPDVEAILGVDEGAEELSQLKALPPETDAWQAAWREASVEARKSEYALRPSGINRSYYTGYGMDMKDSPSDLKPK